MRPKAHNSSIQYAALWRSCHLAGGSFGTSFMVAANRRKGMSLDELMKVHIAERANDVQHLDDRRVYLDSDGNPHSTDDTPAVIHNDGTLEWYSHGMRHREGDLPAVVRPDGGVEFWINDERHRDGDGPAFITSEGELRWYEEGELSRAEGPAVIFPDGSVEYWLHGERQGSEGTGDDDTSEASPRDRDAELEDLIKRAKKEIPKHPAAPCVPYIPAVPITPIDRPAQPNPYRPYTVPGTGTNPFTTPLWRITSDTDGYSYRDPK